MVSHSRNVHSRITYSEGNKEGYSEGVTIWTRELVSVPIRVEMW